MLRFLYKKKAKTNAWLRSRCLSALVLAVFMITLPGMAVFAEDGVGDSGIDVVGLGDDELSINGEKAKPEAQKAGGSAIPGKSETVYDLVAIIIDKNLYEDGSDYTGLSEEYSEVGKTSIVKRIKRYAEDIVDSNVLTDAELIIFDPEKEGHEDLANALENLWRNGSRASNRLAGAVFVGDIPLPVVNKNGNRYVSMFPYTDFSDKAYLFNASKNSFERNEASDFPKPEIWHGVISGAQEDIAKFFDKNHLYYQGHEDFAEFKKKLFIGDLLNEEKKMNDDLYKFYLKYLESWEDLAYKRYNKDWAAELLGDMQGMFGDELEEGEVLPINENHPINKGNADSPGFAALLQENGSGDDPMKLLPDVHSKNVIDQQLPPYYKVLSNYISNVNDWVANTGRYESADAHSLPGLIGMKDEFSKTYLRAVNEGLEAAINELVGMVERPIDILESAELSGRFVGIESVEELVTLGPGVLDTQLVNKLVEEPFSVAISEGVAVDEVLYKYHYADDLSDNGKKGFYVKGVNVDILESPKQCSVYLGSGEEGNLVRSLRSDSAATAMPIRTVGINTRMTVDGALIEDNAAYGIEAFMDNPSSAGDVNPFDGKLMKGDIIVSVSGKLLNNRLSLESAIEELYAESLEVVKAGSAGSKSFNLEVKFLRNTNVVTENFSFKVNKNGGTSGAIFTMYDSDFFDNSAGCNAGAKADNDASCLPLIAKQPLLDAGGSIAVDLLDDEAGYGLGLPKAGLGSGNAGFGSGGIDEFYVNSCYGGMPELSYENLLEALGPVTNNPENANAGLWDGVDALTASDVVLNNVDGKLVTLQDFSARYGLFDGLDNDNDGLVDYEWRDADGDGIYEQKFYDYDEAAFKYGIAGDKLDEIARKLLSQANVFVIPAGLPGNTFGKDLLLEVKVAKKKSISSMILHNEPTEHTIREQLKSLGAMSLPIDDPRYVAFQVDAREELPQYPETIVPVKNWRLDLSDLEEIEDELGEKLDEDLLLQLEGLYLKGHKPVGKIRKLQYPNLFEIDNFAQLVAELKSLANNLAVMPGAYRIFGDDAEAEDYTAIEIRDEIFAKLQPIVTEDFAPIQDVLDWKDLDIDGKHEYVLKKYLNAEEEAFVADSAGGYEAAYLVLDGEGDYFDMNFDKDVDEEFGEFEFEDGGGAAASFGSLDAGLEVSGLDEGATSESSVNGSGVKDEGFEFVWLDQFLEEVGEFAGYFTEVPEFKDACSAVGHVSSKLVEGNYSNNVSAGAVKIFSYGFLGGALEIEGVDEEELMDFSDSFVADGESLIKVEAVTAPGNEVSFEVFDEEFPNLVSFKGANVAVADGDGVASVYLKAGTKTGRFKVRTVVGQGEVGEKLLELVAGPVEIVEVNADTFSLLANGRSKASLDISLRDRFGNLANNSFEQVALFVDDNAYFSEGADINAGIVGTQMASVEGRLSVDLFAGEEAGEANVFALLFDRDLEAAFRESGNDFSDIDFEDHVGNLRQFRVLESMDLKLSLSEGNLVAGSDESVVLKAELMSEGKRVSDYRSDVMLEVLGDAEFVGDLPEKMTNGVIDGVDLKAGKTAGRMDVRVSLPGFVSETVGLEVLPAEAVEIALEAEEDVLFASGKDLVLEAKILDRFGNLVDDDGISVSFSASEGTKDLIDFKTAQSSLSSDGIAKTVLRGQGRSGFVNLMAQAEGLQTGELSLKLKKRFDADDMRDFAPKTPYVSLLGGAFGDPSLEENLAQAALYSGQVQAVSAVTAGISASKRLAYVGPDGEVEAEGLEVMELEREGSESLSYEKKVIGDLAEVFVVPGAGDAEGAGADVIVLDKMPSGVLSPGTYVLQKNSDPRYEIISAFSGASTADAKGIYIVDKSLEINAEQVPGFADSSLESAEIIEGIGFEGDNKHMLLFSAGNSVGESHLPAASEVGIVMGDPMMRLKVDGSEGLTGFTDDLGDPLYEGNESVKEMIDFDLNGDGYDDVLLIYESGAVHFLENEISNGRFEDKGEILRFDGGIISAARIDTNNDGYDDLLLGTRESCNVDETCLSLFSNDAGHFVRETLNLAMASKAYVIKAGDMNNDGCEDAVISDSQGNVRIFHNDSSGGLCNGLENNYAFSDNFGISLGTDEDLGDDLYINYPGMEGPNSLPADAAYDGLDNDKDGSFDEADETSNSGDFISFKMPSNVPEASQQAFAIEAYEFQSALFGNPAIANFKIPEEVASGQLFERDIHFMQAAANARFNNSGKTVAVNQERIDVGDEVEYLLTLRNAKAGDINGLMLSDLLPAAMSFVDGSLECLDIGCNDNLELFETGEGLRPYIIRGISVPSGGMRTIRYRLKIEVTPRVDFDLGNNFIADYPADDKLDIFVRPEMNTEAEAIYLYSDGESYKRFVKKSSGVDLEDLYGDFWQEQIGVDPLALENMDPQSAEFKKQVLNMKSVLISDENYDGEVDSWSMSGKSGGGKSASVKDQLGAAFSAVYANFDEAVSGVVNGAQNIMDDFRCGASGCLPSPYNMAFLAPDGAVPGTALFAAGVPNPLGVAFGYSSALPSTFRLYLNPTLTLGLGISACVGPSIGHASPCFAYALPLDSMGFCPDITGLIEDAVATAQGAVVNTELGMTSMISTHESGDPDAVNNIYNYSTADSPISVATSTNIKVPGFPSVVTNWLDKQTDEIYSKLLDLPDFYLIYPDVKTIISDDSLQSANQGIHSANDFFKAMNSVPLIQLEGREVLVKVPAISQHEIDKYKQQVEFWLADNEDQWQRVKDNWQCDASTERKTVCDKFQVKMTGMTSSIKDILGKLDQLANLPRDVLTFRHAETKYATQVACYLDTIMETTGGYMKRQKRIIDSWMKAIDDVLKTFRDWKAIMDLSVEYQDSCDQCKNDRFSKLGLLMSVFVAIPDPPIIPLPKWPDIVFDMSEIRTGIEIVWPDLVFRPESLKLPDLPVIDYASILNLPSEIAPDFTLDIPAIENPKWIEAFPDVIIPEFPDLPPLPIPELPDLPRPPKIPKLPKVAMKLTKSLKPAFQVLCLLKNGYIPVPESTLATEIETLTQSKVDIALPILKGLGVKWPGVSYDYVEQIKFNAKMNFGIEDDLLYQATKAGADFVNDQVEGHIDAINDFTGFPIDKVINSGVQQLIEQTSKGVTEGIKEGIEGATGAGDDAAAYIEKQGRDFVAAIEDYIAEMDVQSFPDKYHLKVEESFIESDDARLNRSLSELEKDIAMRGVEDLAPGMEHIAKARDSLIAYSKGLDDGNDLLESIDEYGDFMSMIAKEDSRQMASLEGAVGDELVEEQFSFFDEETVELVENEARLLAANVDLANLDPLAELQGGAGQSGDHLAPPVGFYVSRNAVSENILAYTDELSVTNRHLHSDVDLDGDVDIIFSMGGDVYLKRNHQAKEKKFDKGSVIGDLVMSEVSDYARMASVQGVNASAGHKSASLEWLEDLGLGFEDSGDAEREELSYEVYLKDSIYDELTEAVYSYSSDDESLDLDIENGVYYANVLAVGADGERSLISDNELVFANTCGDDEAPLPVLGGTEFNVSLYENLILDAGDSIDSSGEIVEYFMRVLPFTVPKDEAGVKMTITNLGKKISSKLPDGSSNPIFNIGPFKYKGDIGRHEFELNVVDQSGNKAKQDIVVNVFAPEISLNDDLAETGVASGDTEPSSAGVPFALMRNRYVFRSLNGKLALAPHYEEAAKGKTGPDGSYSIDGLDWDNMIEVLDANGETAANVNPKTGNIGALAKGYRVVVHPAELPTLPTRIEVLDEYGEVFASVYFVADSNVDVSINELRAGVNVRDFEEDDFYFEKLPADDASFPGAALGQYEDKTVVLVNSDGGILLFDERVSLGLKENNYLSDDLVIEVLFEGKVVAEVYIERQFVEALQIVGMNDLPVGGRAVTAIDELVAVSESNEEVAVERRLQLEGLNEEEEGLVRRLKEHGVIEVFDGGVVNAEEFMNRQEHTEGLLRLMCIEPREEAYKDLGLYSDLEIAPYVSEASLLGLVHGYKGEVNDEGLSPFRPDNSISRAEAVKVILEALELRGILDLSSLKIGEPWYAPFLVAAQDITPYLKSGEIIQNNFIISAEEAEKPNEALEKRQFIEMASRVLNFYDCLEDAGEDELIEDSERAEETVDDGEAGEAGVVDSDGDGLSDVTEELIYGSDPNNPDTDGGGVSDGEEVKKFTNPLDAADDDIIPETEAAVETGTYLVPPECSSCPCFSTIQYKADLAPGDTFFTVITDAEDKPVSKSAEIFIENVKK